MHVRGRLATRSPSDILEWVSGERKTGVLRFYDPRKQIRKDVWFEDGSVISSGSNRPAEWLGQFLMAKGRISEEDFLRAYRTQTETNVLFGKVLTMIGLVSEAEVLLALREKTEEALLDVFLWTDGYFEFEDNQRPLPEQRLPIDLDVDKVITEGETRQMEWGMIREIFRSAQVVPVLDLAQLQATQAVLDAREKRMLTLAADGKCIAEIALQLHMPEFLVFKRLHDFHKKGLVTGAAEPPTDEDVVEIDIDALENLEDDDPMPPVESPRATRPISDEELKTRIPAIAGGDARLLDEHSFSPEEGYILSRIDGTYDLESVLMVCPFKESLALQVIRSLIDRGIIELKAPPS